MSTTTVIAAAYCASEGPRFQAVVQAAAWLAARRGLADPAHAPLLARSVCDPAASSCADAEVASAIGCRGTDSAWPADDEVSAWARCVDDARCISCADRPPPPDVHERLRAMSLTDASAAVRALAARRLETVRRAEPGAQCPAFPAGPVSWWSAFGRLDLCFAAAAPAAPVDVRFTTPVWLDFADGRVLLSVDLLEAPDLLHGVIADHDEKRWPELVFTSGWLQIMVGSGAVAARRVGMARVECRLDRGRIVSVGLRVTGAQS